MARLQLDQTAIRKYLDRTVGKDMVKRLAHDVQTNANALIPKATGATRATSYNVGNDTSFGGIYRAEVGYRSETALWLHEGTPPHREPVAGYTPMTFYWDKAGRVVTLYKVQHPGIKPNRFLTGPLEAIGRFYGFRVEVHHIGPS